MNITNLSQVASEISCLFSFCIVYSVYVWLRGNRYRLQNSVTFAFDLPWKWNLMWQVLECVCAGWLIILNSNYEEFSCEIWKVHGPRTVIFQKISWLYSSGKFDTFISRQCQFITDIMDTGFSCQGICSMHKS